MEVFSYPKIVKNLLMIACKFQKKKGLDGKIYLLINYFKM